MSLKQYQILCEHCGYKRFTDGTDVKDLVEVKTSAIPRGVPYIDPVTKKLTTPPPMKQVKKFKCPKCGYVVKPRQIQFTETPNEQTNNIDGSQTGTSGQSLPGELT
jgi:DNA-directed RNA polymerase subunit RPC12/RpoP